jgi:hypothetical protein
VSLPRAASRAPLSLAAAGAGAFAGLLVLRPAEPRLLVVYALIAALGVIVGLSSASSP